MSVPGVGRITALAYMAAIEFRPSAMQRVRTHEGERATFGCR